MALFGSRPAEQQPHVAPRRRGRKRRLVAIIAAGVLLSLAAAGFFVYYALLPSALAPRLVAALETRLGPGHTVRVGHTRLVTNGGRIELRVEDLRVVGPDGREVAAAPDARVEIDRDALLHGTVAIGALHLDRPRLVVRSLPDSAPDTPPEAPVSAANRDLLAHLVGTLDRLTAPGGAAAALNEIRVTSAAVILDRGGEGTPETLDRLTVRLVRSAETNGFAATIASEGSVDRWSATLTSSAPSAAGRVFDLGLDSVGLAMLGRLGGLGPQPGFDATVSGHVSISLDANASFRAGEARLDLGDVSFLLPGPKRARLRFDQIQLRTLWDGASRVVRLEPSQVIGGTGRATFVGEARAPAVGSSEPWAIRLQGLHAQLPGEGAEPPLRLDNLDFRAQYRPDRATLELLEGHISGPTANLAMSGSMRFGDSSPAITLGLATAPTSVSAVKRLWPFFVAIPIREWFVESVDAGLLSGFSLSVDIKEGVLASLRPYEPLPDKAIYVESAFADATIRARPGMPALEGATGRFRASGRRVEMTVDSARVDAQPGTSLAIRGKFEVPDTEPRFPPARVVLAVDGPLSGVAQLFARGALGPNPLPPAVDAAAVRGGVSAQSLLSFTLGPAAEVPPIDVKVDAQLKDVAIDRIVAGKGIEGGQFRVVRENGTAILAGEAKVGGAITTIELRDEGESGRREVLASATLDASARAKLGFPGGNAIKGPIGLKIRAPLVGDAATEIQADLSGAEIDGLVPGLKKKAGTPGKMTLALVKNGEGTTLRDIVIESGPASIKGNVELDPAGGLVAAKLGTYRLSSTDDVRITAERPKGVLKVSVDGSSLDLRPLMSDLFAGDAGEATAPDLDLDVGVDSAIGHNGETASGLKLSLSRRSGQLRTLELKSDRFGTGRVNVRPVGDGYLFTGDDAGSFLRFLDIYSKAYGGKFALQISTRIDGQVEVDGFQIRGERALASVTSIDPVRSEERRDSRAAPNTVQFTKLKMGFVRNGGKLLLQDVVVWGPQIGLSVEGTLDFTAERVNVTGTFVPAYALNNLFSKLPVIGLILGGGSHEGLVGVTFRVSGALSNPTLTINPMSAVAPGFLRKLFEFRRTNDGTATAETTGRSNVSPR